MTFDHNEWKKLGDAAYEALLGLRDDVYPCREDVPAELWLAHTRIHSEPDGP